MPDFPQEIITEILHRLPVKPLLRFRSVSKPWRSLIDSKDFAKSQLNHSVKTNSNRSLLIKDTYSDLISVDLDSFENLDIGEPPFTSHRLANSCHGLVLAVSDKPLLWNPATRKYKILPPTPFEFDGGVYINENYGFGYDSKSDDYKVVRVTEVDRDGEYLFSETKIYSLRTNSWRKVEDFPHIVPKGKNVWGVYLNDALHTVVNHCEHCKSIMAFDLGTAEHYEVPSMDLTGVNRGVASVEVMGGNLTALVPRKMNRFEIWVMKEYGVKESWMNLLCFAPQFPEPYSNLTPLAYLKKGDEVLLNYDGRCLLAYDLRKKCSRIVSVRGMIPQFYGITYSGSTFSAEVCVGSLVSLDSPDEVDKKTKKQAKQRKKKAKRMEKKIKKNSFVSLDNPDESDDKTTKQTKQGKEEEEKIKKKRDDFLSVGFKLKL